jgi:hypothetical protein
VIKEYAEDKSPLARAYFLSLSQLILDRLYIIEDDRYFKEFCKSIDCLPQDLRYRFKSVLDRKRIKRNGDDSENVVGSNESFEKIPISVMKWIDLLVVGEQEGHSAFGIEVNSHEKSFEGVSLVCSEIVQFCSRVSSFQSSGDIKPDIDRSIIWPKLFQRDVENAPYISIVDRYFLKTLANGRSDNGCKWILEQINGSAMNCRSLKIFAEFDNELDPQRIKNVVDSLGKNINTEIFAVDSLVWKSQQHQRYIRYGTRGLLFLDPGFDVFTNITRKAVTYIKKSDQKDLIDRQSWENSNSQKSKMVSFV